MNQDEELLKEEAEQELNPENENGGSLQDIINISEEDLQHADEDIASALAMLGSTKLTSGKKVTPVVDQEIPESEESVETVPTVIKTDEMKSTDDSLLKEKLEKEIKLHYEDQLGKLKKTIISLQKKSASDAKEIESLRKKTEELNEHWVRVSADFQNYQKRMKSKLHEFIELERINLIRDILIIVDDLRRAVESTEESVVEKVGVEMIFKQVMQLLTKWEVTEIKALGETFDPVVHDAIDRVSQQDIPDNQIVGVYSHGYFMGSKIIKPSKVIVNCLRFKLSNQSEQQTEVSLPLDDSDKVSSNEISDDKSLTDNVESSGMNNGSESSVTDDSTKIG